MYKEFIIIIGIIILVILGDFLTQKYTKTTVMSLTNKLEELKENLKNNKIDNSIKNVEDINNTIEKSHTFLAYYIEHDELEKAETYFTSCQSYVYSQNFDLALQETEKTIFVLNHITDRYSFNLENIL